MNTRRFASGFPFLCAITLALVLLVSTGSCTAAVADETAWHAIEMHGQLVGYQRVDVWLDDNAATNREHTHIVMKLTALGQPFDMGIDATRTVDPATGKTVGIDFDMLRGDQKLGSTIEFRDGTAICTPKDTAEPKTVELDPDVIIDHALTFPYLVEDLGEGSAESKTYKVFDPFFQRVAEKTFTRVGSETLRYLGAEYDCLVFESKDHVLGISGKLWIDRETARMIRSEISNGVATYLDEATVAERIERGNLDDQIFGDVDVAIADFQAIDAMKIRARIRVAGETITADSLNVPGQTFTGTVEDNVLTGIFEIAHPSYDGAGAPPFPADWSGDESLAKYLEPEVMIESRDPAIVAKAREITEGAADSWDAAMRLSKWVAEEIGYSVPGGSARHTLDTRKGECGSHSRLMTALGRAAGIPTRLVSGAMYTPMRGGSFGQHAWNEVYMGEAGWIPFDTTAREIDYVDSGHLRLGEMASFTPEEMEVLDYRAGSASMSDALKGLGAVGEIPWTIGETFTFSYSYEGKPIGTETLTVTGRNDTTMGPAYTCESHVKVGSLDANSRWKLDWDGTPVSYASQGTARGVAFMLDTTYTADKATVKIEQGETKIDRSIDVPDPVYLLANNNIGLVAFLASCMPDDTRTPETEAPPAAPAPSLRNVNSETEAPPAAPAPSLRNVNSETEAPPAAPAPSSRRADVTRSFQLFHPPSMQVLAAQMTDVGRETISWNGQQVPCRVLEMTIAGQKLTLWIDDKGRLLRESEQAGKLLIELTP